MRKKLVILVMTLLSTLSYGQIIDIDYNSRSTRVLTIEKKGLLNSSKAAHAYTKEFISSAEAQKSLLGVQDSKILKAQVKNCYEGKSIYNASSYISYSCVIEFTYRKN
ncbi:MAG: hypothetical protein QE271_05460 [Bacteriovoracaceae bacterium]|nr:hypothetical protein [Bacteriovoracaceae bacterium]